MYRLLAICCLAVLLAVPGTASAWDLNKDFYNTTGQPANDIEIILDGLVTVTEHYDGDPGAVFPNFEVYPELIGSHQRTVLRWSGLNVASGTKVHVGYTAGNAQCVGMRWTWNGQPVGPVIQLNPNPFQNGFGVVLANNLEDSLWPVIWPWTPPPYLIERATVYYFSSLVPLPSLNLGALPAWTPITSNVVWYNPAEPLWVNPGMSQTLVDPNPPLNAVSAVWVLELNTAPGAFGGSTDFVQFDLQGSVPVRESTWGRVKTLYR